MNIRHEPLFSFETLLKYEPRTRLSKILDALDLDIIPANLSRSWSRGPLGYNRTCLLRALIAKYVYGIPNTAKLVERLHSDIGLRYDCGFALYGGIPSEATFSRFTRLLANEATLR